MKQTTSTEKSTEATDLRNQDQHAGGIEVETPEWVEAPDESSDASAFEMVDLSEGDVFAAAAARSIVGPIAISDFQDLHAGVGLQGLN